MPLPKKEPNELCCIRTPTLSFWCVQKDSGTQGAVYCAWATGSTECVVSQSLPVLNRWLCTQYAPNMFYASSLCKVCRGHQRHHLGWTVERHWRGNMARLNRRLAQFSHLVLLARFPDNWQLTPRDIPVQPPLPVRRSASSPAAFHQSAL